MMSDATLFHGIAVVIDDEIHDEAASVVEIRKAIEEAGCHVVPLAALPSEAAVGNLREVAFFVLDWKLWGTALKELGGGETVEAPVGMVAAYEENNLKFLRDLKKVRFAPVFIFTDENVDHIKDKLRQHKDLYDESDPSHILVMKKGEVSQTGLFTVLNTWMSDAPSVYVLKKWERAYERAKNQLFLDFYTKSTLWPLIVWKTFKDDSMPPAALLGDLIGRNLTSRLTTFDCNLEPYLGLLDGLDKDSEAHKETVRRVLEGERFLAAERLDEGSFEPGDIFEATDGSGYWINMRPDCDCIPRGNDKLDKLDLYMLKGTERPFGELKYDAEYGLIPEQDNEAIIFPVHNGKALCFKFRKLYTLKYRDIKSRRIGRLLPPFLTRLQQRYAAYLQRPGLNRLPSVAFPSPVPESEVPAIDTVAAARPEPAATEVPRIEPVKAPQVAEVITEKPEVAATPLVDEVETAPEIPRAVPPGPVG
jgi:hypothetical protein